MKSTVFALLFSLFVISCGKKAEEPAQLLPPLPPYTATFTYYDENETVVNPDLIKIFYVKQTPPQNPAIEVIPNPVSGNHYYIPDVMSINKVELYNGYSMSTSYTMNPVLNFNIYQIDPLLNFHIGYTFDTRLIIVMDEKFEMIN